MIIYSVQCKVKAASAVAWEKYFQEIHLDDVFNTGCFTGYLFKKEKLADGQFLFISDYYCPSLETLEEYNQKHAAALKKDVIDKFAGQFSAKRNIYHIVVKK